MISGGLAHPFVVRLLAVVLAVAGAGGVAGRAPQALRAWTDTAAEVARDGRATRPAQGPTGHAVRPADPPNRPVASGAAATAALVATAPWPLGADLRTLLALKQARLI